MRKCIYIYTYIVHHIYNHTNTYSQDSVCKLQCSGQGWTRWWSKRRHFSLPHFLTVLLLGL